MRLSKIAIVGVGLIGGSIGLALRRRGLAERILGIDKQPSVLEQSVARGAIDEGSSSLQAAGAADLVVFCTPVNQIAPNIVAVAPACATGTILTDVGSTKAKLVRDL